MENAAFVEAILIVANRAKRETSRITSGAGRPIGRRCGTTRRPNDCIEHPENTPLHFASDVRSKSIVLRPVLTSAVSSLFS
jgi:hypothetical protein